MGVLSLLEQFDAFSSYSVNRSVTVKNVRLALIHRSIQLLITVALLFQILLQHTYARFETPMGSYDLMYKIDRTGYTLLDPRYCNASDIPIDPFIRDQLADQLECKDIDFSMLKVQESTISATASIGFADFDGKPLAWSYVNYVEDMQVLALVDASASFHMPESSTIPTNVYDSEGNLYKTFPDNVFTLTIGEFIKLAGISLDDIIYDTYYEIYLLRRTSGLKLRAILTYSNLRPNEFGSHYRCDLTVDVVDGAWGGSDTYMAEIDGQPAVAFPAAVQVQFMTRGLVGTFSWYNFILYLLTVMVLLDFASALLNNYGIRYIFKSEQVQALELKADYAMMFHDDGKIVLPMANKLRACECGGRMSARSSIASISSCTTATTIGHTNSSTKLIFDPDWSRHSLSQIPCTLR
eukprot:TRINITY_DN4382_c0_g1::TRINITY_DN4382_c0_g1_i1::g.21231::m.21231 TRINITY_DN4382_c0_g1::TRINITY_DN4382_c0_g1_i1::g.21231  ORF type:complete len:409 (+),score=49.29,P2X_receptor/PF00864.14/0.0027,P2X_receptor/PF00864.14/1.7e+03,DUF1282/PF06930.7/0.1 TRINITY_DN4382_c0_g1_i1:138-1364(+)